MSDGVIGAGFGCECGESIVKCHLVESAMLGTEMRGDDLPDNRARRQSLHTNL